MTIDAAYIPASRTPEGKESRRRRALKGQMGGLEAVGGVFRSFTRATKCSVHGALIGLSLVPNPGPNLGNLTNRTAYALHQGYLSQIEPGNYLTLERAKGDDVNLMKRLMAADKDGKMRLGADEYVDGAGQALADSSAQGADTGIQAANKVLGIADNSAVRPINPQGYNQSFGYESNNLTVAPNAYNEGTS